MRVPLLFAWQFLAGIPDMIVLVMQPDVADPRA